MNTPGGNLLPRNPDTRIASGRGMIGGPRNNPFYSGVGAVKTGGISYIPAAARVWNNPAVERPPAVFRGINRLYPEPASGNMRKTIRIPERRPVLRNGPDGRCGAVGSPPPLLCQQVLNAPVPSK